MAKPIKETPILTERDRPNFFQQMKDAENKNSNNTVSGSVGKIWKDGEMGIEFGKGFMKRRV